MTVEELLKTCKQKYGSVKITYFNNEVEFHCFKEIKDFNWHLLTVREFEFKFINQRTVLCVRVQ